MPVIKASFDALGPDHICFGSDFPYELNKGQYAKSVIEDVCSLDVPQEDKRKFLDGNIKRFFSR
jgi:predicted TIM-barrel fold metal-dependent hydrolase